MLGHLEEPALVKPANPDLGLDGVMLGVNGGHAPRGFQAKHFTRGISWPQCRKSLDAAVKNYDVKHVTFTFPFDLTGKQISMNFTLARDPGNDRIEQGGVLQIRRQLWIVLFSRRFELGEEATYVSDYQVTSSEAATGGSEFVLRPVIPDSKMLTRLERPAARGGQAAALLSEALAVVGWEEEPVEPAPPLG